MVKNTHLFLLTAALSAGLVAGCEADQSAPNRAEMEKNLQREDTAAKQNAEKRIDEGQHREVPGNGKEFPGQSKVDTQLPPGDAPVLLAASGFGPDDARQPHPGRGPQTKVDPDKPYVGIPANGIVVPNTGGQILDPSWGTVAPLNQYPHRAWPQTVVTYHSGAVFHNPIYFHDLDYSKEMGDKPYTKDDFVDWHIAAADIPWAPINGLITPILMIFHWPLQEAITSHPTGGGVYHGHYSTGGRVDPSPTPGKIAWNYPQIHLDGDNEPATQPANP